MISKTELNEITKQSPMARIYFILPVWEYFGSRAASSNYRVCSVRASHLGKVYNGNGLYTSPIIQYATIIRIHDNEIEKYEIRELVFDIRLDLYECFTGYMEALNFLTIQKIKGEYNGS